MSTTNSTKKVFALGGQIVRTPKQARTVLIDAIKTRKEWLIPQAESVLRQLRKELIA